MLHSVHRSALGLQNKKKTSSLPKYIGCHAILSPFLVYGCFYGYVVASTISSWENERSQILLQGKLGRSTGCSVHAVQELNCSRPEFPWLRRVFFPIFPPGGVYFKGALLPQHISVKFC